MRRMDKGEKINTQCQPLGQWEHHHFSEGDGLAGAGGGLPSDLLSTGREGGASGSASKK